MRLAASHVVMQQGKSTEGSYWRRAAVRIAAISSWSMLLWGSWALAANLSYGVEAAARAGLTQGASSLTLTCLQTAILEAVSRRCAGPAAEPGATRHHAASTLHRSKTLLN